MYVKKQTLEDDFSIWWDLPKYKNKDFEVPLQYQVGTLENFL